MEIIEVRLCNWHSKFHSISDSVRGYIVLFILFAVSNGLYSQNYNSLYFPNHSEKELPYHLLSKIQSLDDFIARYNGYNNAYGQDADRSSSEYQEIFQNKAYWQEYRYRIIGGMVDEKLLKNDSIRSIEFVNRASQGPELSFYSKDWFCRIPIVIKWNSNTTHGELFLKIWFDDQKRSKWVIQDCIFEEPLLISSIPDVIPDICPEIYLTPVSHENNFIALRRLLGGDGVLDNHMIKSSKGLAQLKHLIEIDEASISFSHFFFHFNPYGELYFVLDTDYKIIEFYEKN